MWEYNYGYLSHHGIKGQRWGIRRYQNPDGTLTAAGRRHLKQVEKKDIRWVKKNSDKIVKKTQRQIAKELSRYGNDLLSNKSAFNKNGKISASTINEYNKKMAELMNKKVSDLSSPSGKAVRFVAKRGDIGVMVALADPGYDFGSVKNGVWESGKIAYKKETIKKI